MWRRQGMSLSPFNHPQTRAPHIHLQHRSEKIFQDRFVIRDLPQPPSDISRLSFFKTFVAHAQRSDLVVAALHSRWFACARHGAVSMPRRSARLALQRERAESRPVEPVSIPLDDDTDSLVSVGVAATCAVCGERSSSNMVHIPCCDYAAHQGCVRNGVCPFCSSDAVDIVAVQPLRRVWFPGGVGG